MLDYQRALWIEIPPHIRKYRNWYGLLASSLYKDDPEIDGPGRASLNGQQAKIQIAEAFIKSIMVKYKSIPKSQGMFVLRDVVDLESGELQDIVIRNITELFWQACINTVNTPNKRYRVCAVGTTGTGKTTSTPILIRMLLKEKRTVVYLPRTEMEDEWYYEFKYNNKTNDIVSKVYPEATKRIDIASLGDSSTY